jgi:hypothetical protein
MAMSFHLLVRSSGSLRAQDGSPLQRPPSEMNDGRSIAVPHVEHIGALIEGERGML